MADGDVAAPTMAELTARVAGPGSVRWIGLRPARRAEMEVVEAAALGPTGLDGDRHARENGRALTLVQAEHLPVIAQLAHRAEVPPELLRRNLVVAGLNITAMRGRLLAIGPTTVVEITGPCAPCSRMEEALGPGGYTAMRGHGGMTARVRAPGPIALGDPVRPVEAVPAGD